MKIDMIRPIIQDLPEAAFGSFTTLSLPGFDVTSFAHLGGILRYSSLQVLSSFVWSDGGRRSATSRPLLCCLGFCARGHFPVLLDGEPFARSEALSASDQLFIEDISVLCCEQSSCTCH